MAEMIRIYRAPMLTLGAVEVLLRERHGEPPRNARTNEQLRRTRVHG